MEHSYASATAFDLGRAKGEDWVVRPTSHDSPIPHTPARHSRRSPQHSRNLPAETAQVHALNSSDQVADKRSCSNPSFLANDVGAAAALSRAHTCGVGAAAGATWSNAGLLLLPEEDEDSHDEESQSSACWAGHRHPATSAGANLSSPPAGGGVVLDGPGPGLGQEDSVSSVGAAPATPFSVPAPSTRHASPSAAAAAGGLFVEGAIVRAIARLSPGPEGRQGRAGAHLTGLLLSPPPAERAEAAVQASPEPPPAEADPVRVGAPPPPPPPPPAADAAPRSSGAAQAGGGVPGAAGHAAPSGSEGRLPAFPELGRPPARPGHGSAADGAKGVALSDLGGGAGVAGGLRVVVRVGDECRASSAAPPWAGLRAGEAPPALLCTALVYRGTTRAPGEDWAPRCAVWTARGER